MIIYLIVLTLAILNFSIQQRKEIRILNLFLFVFMMLVCAMRAEGVGSDTVRYLYSFARINELQGRESLEFVYKSVVVFFSGLSFSPQGIQFILSLIAYSAFYKLFIKYSGNIALAILLFIISSNAYFSESFNIVRQICATPFILLSILSIRDRAFVKSVFYMIIGIGFHMSSLIFIPVIFFAYYVKINYKIVLIASLSSFLFAIISASNEFVVNMLEAVMPAISNSRLSDLDKYSGYTNYLIDFNRSLNGLLYLILPHTFICVFTYKRMNGDFISRIYFIGVVIFNLISAMPTGYRMVYALTALELIILPCLWVSTYNKDYNIKYTRRCIVVIVMALVLGYIYILMTKGEQARLIPYSIFY